MASAYYWIFNCPLCGHRQIKWNGKKLMCKLEGEFRNDLASEDGCGEIAIVGRGFFKVCKTTMIPRSMINVVMNYLTEHHKQYVKAVGKILDLDKSLIGQFVKEDAGMWVVFEAPDGTTHIVSREQALILHDLERQAKYAELAKKQKTGIVRKMNTAASIGDKWRRVHNKKYYANAYVIIGEDVSLIDKVGRLLPNSTIKVSAIKSSVYQINKAMKERPLFIDYNEH